MWSAVQRSWARFWFEPIPPHSYALLRILIGLFGCATLIGLSDLSLFWAPDGLVPDASEARFRHWLLAVAGDVMGPWLLYLFSLLSFTAMTIGFRSSGAVTASFLAALMQLEWNPLPLAAAHSLLTSLLFCLLWVDCGAVWSLDAWLRRRGRRGTGTETVSMAIAALRLVRFQLALLYLSAGIWKLSSPLWRDGSALHYALSYNVFHRFPLTISPQWEWLVMLGNYTTLVWELAFAFAIWFKATRVLILVTGIFIHLGMMLGIEIGPFSLLMLSGYTAFINPHWLPNLPGAVRRFLGSRDRRRAAHPVSAKQA